jgi:diacylglycerol kinase (ATP)
VNKSLIILNPAAKGARARKLQAKVASLSSQTELRITHSIGDARKIARSAVEEGFDAVIAAGGDGTINEVVNGIAGSQVRLGILPVGTMNVFAQEIGIPLGNLEKAWDVIERGACVDVDLPLANDRHFIQLAGVGLDAEVVRKTTIDFKNALGPLSYLLTLVQVVSVQPPRVFVEPKGMLSCEGCFVLIGNGRNYGGPFPLFKRASLYDGLLDVVVFKNQSHWDVVRYFQAIAFGTHPNLPDVDYFQTEALKIHSAGEVPMELDGESAGILPCDFSVSSFKLRVFAPC